MSVAISWANKMQLAKCDIMIGFPISSHNLVLETPIMIKSTSNRAPFTSGMLSNTVMALLFTG